ncbi:hypothetical protein CCR95_20020 [Thiocystis minor]|uniref:SPOR domain-containing protein n=1 Tax=Thiocystis minor TaxID=61597 RepID=UPI001912ACD1|nr:SPOR domain-containing protein [Thiocystis minor]MBK5966309.1 hypothetical protein [Thiocystis minor]
MENDQDSQHQNHPNKDDMPLEQISESLSPEFDEPPGERVSQAVTDAESGNILARLVQQAAQIDTLSANLEQQRVAFQEAELALVTRIADVDDDRRLTATRLQRSWQSYRDEMEDGFKRRSSMLVGILLLFGILVAISLVYFYVAFDQTRKTVADEAAELRHAIRQLQSQIPDRVTQNQLTQEKLSQLSVAMKSISMSLENLNKTPAVPVTTHDSEPVSTASSQTVAQAESTGDVMRDAQPRLQENQAVVAITDSEDPLSTESPPMLELPTFDAPSTTMPEPISDETTPPEPRVPAADNGTSGEQEAFAAPARINIDEAPYTLQLIGFFSLEDLKNYVRRYPALSPVYYQEETYQGRPWFVLIHSLHASRESANSAIAKLPPEFAKLDLWVRKLDSDSTVIPLNAAPHH